MFISKIMTRNPVTVDQDADILHAQELMSKHHFHQLPVVDAHNFLIGIVTDRDIRSSLWPSHLEDDLGKAEWKRFSAIKIKDIMTKKPVTISPLYTLQDALLLLQKKRVGAFPVVDETGILKGIISVSDLLKEFINVLGLEEPGMLLCIIVENKIGQMKKIVDAITEEHISFGSILVARYWEEGKRAVFPYLLTQNIGPLKRKLKNMGYTLLDPMDWHTDR
ncbi:MAG: CBS domain-containing protein [Desulfobacteraceae bacterium]|nr:CBS domain-containing protein [Desulfobacteraceae bacterium]MDH3565745.1 CBS domain-containing protein [Desulfobacteraceae bacterium]